MVSEQEKHWSSTAVRGIHNPTGNGLEGKQPTELFHAYRH